MRIFLIFLSMFFLTACGSNENELAGIKIGSKLDDIKDLNSYELIESYFKDDKSCRAISFYYKKTSTGDIQDDLVIISASDGIVRGLTEEFNYLGKNTINPVVINDKQKYLTEAYGEPSSLEEIEISSDVTAHIHNYMPLDGISNIKFTHMYYKNSDNSSNESYIFSLYDDIYTQVENMKEVDNCN